jgi:hypothetical protein
MLQRNIEIFPREKKHWFLLVACLVFASLLTYRLCIGLPIRGTMFSLPLSVFTVILILKKNIRRGTPSVVIAAEFMELHYSLGCVAIPLTDIDSVGVCTYSLQKMIGIRLKCYDRFLEVISPALIKYMVYERSNEASLFSWIMHLFGMMPLCQRVFSRNPTILEGKTPTSLWIGFDGLDIPDGFNALGTLGLLVQTLLFSRLVTGYDLTLRRSEVDRPIENFVTFLNSYLSKS